MLAGEGKSSVFLFSDTQIKDEAFVEDINNLLNSGEVPNMFPSDEKMQVRKSSHRLQPLCVQQWRTAGSVVCTVTLPMLGAPHFGVPQFPGLFPAPASRVGTPRMSP